MSLIEPVILFLCSIALFIYAYMSYKGKLSHKGGYFLAPQDEREQPGFARVSKIVAVITFLGGIWGILFGCQLVLHQEWIKLVIMVLAIIIIVIVISAGIWIGFGKQNENNQDNYIKPSLKLSHELEKGKENFSIIEIRISALRFPIIFGCYVLFPIILVCFILVFMFQIPSEYFDYKYAIPILIFSVILGFGGWILNKLLPKMTFSYKDGVFVKEKNGRIIVEFPVESIAKIKMDSPVMPNHIHFYLRNQKKPVKVSMLGFKQDDRFQIPRKVISITGMRLTKAERKMLDDFQTKNT